MKLSKLSFLIVAAFGVCGLAAPAPAPAPAPGNIDNTPAVEVPPDNPSVKALQISTSAIEKSTNASASSSSNTSLLQRQHEYVPYVPDGTLIVEISSNSRQGGSTGGGRFYDFVWKTLKYIGCVNGGEDTFQIWGITGRNSHFGYLDFTVTVERCYFGDNGNVHSLMIGVIAGIMEDSFLNDQNCYKYGNGRYCSVPRKVSVIVPAGLLSYGQDYRLHVQIKTASPENNLAGFDCVGLLGHANSVVDHYLSEFYDDTWKLLDRNVICTAERSGSVTNDDMDEHSPTNSTANSSTLSPIVPSSNASVKGLQRSTSSIENSARTVDGIINISIGSEKQHIGNLHGGSLYNVIYTALEEICPQDQIQCSCPAPNSCDKSKVSISSGTIFDASMQVKTFNFDVIVDNSMYGNNLRLRKLLIGTVAGIIQAAADNDDNCVFKAGKRFCNVANTYDVSVPFDVLPGLHIAEMHVRIQSTSHHMGTFDCAGLLTPANSVVDDLRSEYNAATGRSNLDRNVICPASHTTGGTDNSNTLSPVSSNVTVLQRSITDTEHEHNVYIEIANQKVNVGNINGHDLWKEVYNAVSQMCPEIDHHFGQTNCTRAGNPKKFQVQALVSPNGIRPIDVYVYIWTSDWGSNFGLREVMIDTVARVFWEAVKITNKNCEQHLNIDHETFATDWFCNVPNYVHVGTYDERAGHSGWLDVRLSSSHPFANLDCVGMLTPVNSLLDNEMMAHFSAVLNGQQMDRNVVCEDMRYWPDPPRAIDAANFTAPETSPSDKALQARADWQPILYVEMANQMVNIGKLPPPDVYKIVKQQLELLCPETAGSTSGGCIGTHGPFQKFTVWTRIDGSGQDHQVDVWMHIWRSDWGHDLDLRRLMIDTVAKTLEEAVKITFKNCQDVSILGDNTPYKWFCNIPNFVSVSVPDNFDGPDGPHGRYLDVQFLQPRHFGIFDCVGTLAPVNTMIEADLMRWYERYTGVYLEKNVVCVDNDRAFPQPPGAMVPSNSTVTAQPSGNSVQVRELGADPQLVYVQLSNQATNWWGESGDAT